MIWKLLLFAAIIYFILWKVGSFIRALKEGVQGDRELPRDRPAPGGRNGNRVAKEDVDDARFVDL